MNVERAAEVLRVQFPELAGLPVEYLGEGCDSQAFHVGGRWVFRFPKRAEVERQLRLETRVLPVLAGTSPVALPDYRFCGVPSDLFPRHFGGYARLPGVPAIQMADERVPNVLAETLARFLGWLHSFPIEQAAVVGVERADVAALVDEVREDALSDLDNVRRVAPEASTDAWHAYLLQPPSVHPTEDTVLVHGDFAAEHVLIDPRTINVTGVIDWSSIAIGHRAEDLAGLFHWGGRRFAEAVLDAYPVPVDEPTLDFARYLAACRGAADVTFGIQMGRHEYVGAGLRALTHCVED